MKQESLDKISKHREKLTPQKQLEMLKAGGSVKTNHYIPTDDEIESKDDIECIRAKRKLKCECGESLKLIVKTEEEVIYTIKDDGSIEAEDSRGAYQTFNLECQECDSRYEFKEDECFELEERPQLFLRWFRNNTSMGELVKQNLNELEITKL